ncbi:LysR family transcriptional regulator [Methylotenera mobilis]|uniref:Transcriptional regulator, LysR family n=1 Tax=Methylotenera mobilis (strain JLW8 / ATCC BAA-1282 / DSM 17540) TaxID=583345 RepID=C6WTX8_METML|nr:LysR family transcriptional regulator [Methylotenera mobilis]ACT47377.1 transcriptional regulator, LysR family [Methylotenera mobilis JLW8]
MDFNESAVFVKVVQAGSFSEAARQIGLPTSTVSTRISRLEKRLGITLLQRTTRRLSLTEAGAVYYQHAAQGLSYLLEAEAAIDEARQQPQGKLKVTAPADLGDSLLANLIQRAQRDFPELEMELLLTDRYIDLVADGVDVAIRTGDLRDSSLIAKSLGIIHWELFASKDYLKSAAPLEVPQDIHAHHCLQFTPMGRDAWTLSNEYSHITIPLPARTMANSIGVVKSMAENGQGIALLPAFVCKQGLISGDLLRVLPDWQGRADPVHLVYPKQRFMPPKLRAFLDLAQDELRPQFSC